MKQNVKKTENQTDPQRLTSGIEQSLPNLYPDSDGFAQANSFHQVTYQFAVTLLRSRASCQAPLKCQNTHGHAFPLCETLVCLSEEAMQLFSCIK